MPDRAPDGQRRGRSTIRDVAAKAGVDPSLVSRVVNGDPKAGASATTRQRILDAVAALEYSPNVAARGLRMARTFTLGLLLPSISNPMYADIARSAARRAEERGYGLVFGVHVDGGSTALTPLLREGRVDGLLVASGLIGDASLSKFAKDGKVPVVMVNRRVRGIKPSVIVDDAMGSAAAVQHLHELGHHSIAGIFGPSAIDTSRRRRNGFVQATASLGIDAVSVEVESWDAAAGRSAATEIISEHPHVTAIFASTFAIGMGVLRAAHDADVDVPGALSVVALHDSEIADYLGPALTTVAMAVEEMADQAVDHLIELIEGGVPRSIVINSAPVVRSRASSGRVSSND